MIAPPMQTLVSLSALIQFSCSLCARTDRFQEDLHSQVPQELADKPHFNNAAPAHSADRSFLCNHDRLCNRLGIPGIHTTPLVPASADLCQLSDNQFIPMLSSNRWHRIPYILRSALSTMIALNDKRLRILQNKLYQSSCDPLHSFRC